ncbi:hypothetical protein PF002_g28265 [Phytophthora fragariae]|uniref:RxLR effector protein n=1 Tax=Phytophthora fragariae TaxID=53985 RepID=A0A6A3W208_9STRA|nr:hypothetical protein PF003_g24104 [Phytophthora fragariae]KAE8920879.1 hypothetical protein PF009_g28833 [Phytophthora fragariae]KAE9177721.1 hypothetical protein PF002_g28265 [Phytophthora fragariae]KAE9275475.1 hypothetical protein PF001_g26566 [Phytophthora fragariae]
MNSLVLLFSVALVACSIMSTPVRTCSYYHRALRFQKSTHTRLHRNTGNRHNTSIPVLRPSRGCKRE